MNDTTTAEAGAETVVAEAVVAEVAATNPDIESRARRMGWRPKEEFRGDPNRWTDAQNFVERGESELPVLRERYRALDDRFVRTETELKSTKDALGEVKTKLDESQSVMMEMRDLGRKAEERAYMRARRELETQMAHAVETADREGYRRAKIELDDLEQTRPPPVAARVETPRVETVAQVATQQTVQVDPVVQEWVGENGWFSVDAKLRAYATEFHGELLREKPGMSLRDNLAEVKREVMTRFPEKFGNVRRDAPAAVSTTPAPARSSKKGKSFEDLPAEAKAAFTRYKRSMPDYKEEDYAKVYFAGEE